MISRRSAAAVATLLFAGGLVAADEQGPARHDGPAPSTASAPPTAPKPAGPAAPPVETRKKRARVVSDLSGFELLDSARLEKKPVVAGATRGTDGSAAPVILAPQLGKLHGARPVFAWRHDAERFTFVLADESGQDVHAAEVVGNRYAWPADAPRLQDGKTYLWSVRPTNARETALPSMAAVVVVSAAERRLIDDALRAVKAADAYEEGLARARVFVDRRVWYDALGTYDELVARFPDRPEAHQARAVLCSQIPAARGQAEEDFARADALAAEPALP